MPCKAAKAGQARQPTMAQREIDWRYECQLTPTLAHTGVRDLPEAAQARARSLHSTPCPTRGVIHPDVVLTRDIADGAE